MRASANVRNGPEAGRSRLGPRVEKAARRRGGKWIGCPKRDINQTPDSGNADALGA